MRRYEKKIIEQTKVPLPTIKRLPMYLSFLLAESAKGRTHISSSEIADSLALTGIQVRKDLAWITNSGKPRTGFPITILIEDIKEYLGYKIKKHAIIVGAGHLGMAFLHYEGFDDYGIKIAAAFDSDKSKIGKKVNNTQIFSLDDFEEVYHRYRPELAILTVPADVAQEACDRLVKYGLKAIWNFAPTLLKVPNDVRVETIDMARSLAVLWRQMLED